MKLWELGDEKRNTYLSTELWIRRIGSLWLTRAAL